MKKIIARILVITILAIGVLGFSSCSKVEEFFGTNVPVYKKMTLSAAVDTIASAHLLYGNGNNSDYKGNNGNEGNHYGNYKGDVPQGKPDDENPFPESPEEENIENEIESTLEVDGAVEEIYYTTPNKTICVNILINNPDQYEILSFTLNGKKYTNYMFEKGSTLELIKLNVNVGDVSGIVEYTIDQIKYVQGSQIRDVKMEGDKTVKAGVRTKNQVEANVTSESVSLNSLKFSVDIADKDKLIEYSNGVLEAVIYYGDTILDHKILSLGKNDVEFGGLDANSVYQYAIVGYYDGLEGGGFGTNVLLKAAFRTEAVVLFDEVEVGKTSVNYNFRWHESIENRELTSLKLYDSGTFVKDINLNATSIESLPSNHIYTLVAEYMHLDKKDNIKLEFTPTIFDYTLEGEEVTITGCRYKDESSIVIPEYIGEYAVTRIGSDAFSHCDSFTSISVPQNVKAIGDFAFSYCSALIEVIFADNSQLLSLGKWVFVGCASLVNIEIPVNVTSIGGGVFARCNSITFITIPFVGASVYHNDALNYLFYEGHYYYGNGELAPKSLVEIVITSACYISDSAFRECASLTSIVIPNSVRSIGSYAFEGCSSLTDVYYAGSESEWTEIRIGFSNDCLTNATIHYNYVLEE